MQQPDQNKRCEAYGEVRNRVRILRRIFTGIANLSDINVFSLFGCFAMILFTDREVLTLRSVGNTQVHEIVLPRALYHITT
jgi:hypothetical protein